MLKKNLWIVALIAALAMIFAGCDGGGSGSIEFDPNIPDLVFEGDEIGGADADITVISIGNTAGQSVDGAVYSLATTGIAADSQVGSAGFGFTFPADGLTFKYVQVEVEITTIDSSSAAAFTVKKSTAMDDLSGFGANSNPAYSRNAEINVGDKVGDTGITAEMEGDDFVLDKLELRLFQGGFYAQFNGYSEYWNTGKTPPTAWEDAAIAAKLKGNQNFSIKVTKVTFTNGGVPAEFIPVTEVQNMPAKAVAGLITVLPEKAHPVTAANRDIVWTVKEGDAEVEGRVLRTPTAGTVKVTATVANGATATTPFVQDYTITVGAPNGIFLDDFSTGASGSDAGAAYADGVWTIPTGYKPVFLAIGETLSSTDFIYDAVTILYITDAAPRFSFANGTSILKTQLDGSNHGGWEGSTDLPPSDPATLENQVRIKLADIGSFDGIVVESKGSAVNIELLAVYFEKKEVCEFCSGVLSGVETPAGHAVTCLIPVTSITRVPGSGIANFDVTLPALAYPSYATNRDITWTVVTDGATNASISGVTLSTTAVGTVKVKGSVVNGATSTTPFEKEFDIVINPLEDIVLTNFATGGGYGSSYADGVWTFTHGFQRVTFNIGATVMNTMYDKVEIEYEADRDCRIGLGAPTLIGDNDTGWTEMEKTVATDGGAFTGTTVKVTRDIDSLYDDAGITAIFIDATTGAFGGAEPTNLKIVKVTFKVKE